MVRGRRRAIPGSGVLRLSGLALILGAPCQPAPAREAVAAPHVEAGEVLLSEISVSGSDVVAPPLAGPIGVAAPPGSAAAVIENPVGQTATRIGRQDTIADRPATTIGSALLDSPGVSVRQGGGGGRDVVVSIRGNNARPTGGIKNLVLVEDGFVLTQPDGLARFDLTDPRAYAGATVFRGPQSALFGIYATGGAIALRTRTAAEIDGYEIGVDAGGFGYLSPYVAVGQVSGPAAITLFSSDARANGYQGHSSYDTQIVNLLASLTPSPDNRFVLKVINNQIGADLAVRNSLAEYRINPYQRGCAAAAVAAPGCGLVSLFRNGAYGATVPVSADEGGFGRTDRRTVVAARWEHDLDAWTSWRTQAVFYERNFDQPYYATASRGSYPSWSGLSELTRRGDLFGIPALGYAALSFGTIDSHATTFARAPYGGPRLGALLGDLESTQTNLGGRARVELALASAWTGVLGLGLENTWLAGQNRAYATTAAGTTATRLGIDRSILNLAPEAALVYRPDPAWALRGRAAAGYGTPVAANLFVTPDGLPGDNTGLKTQRNLGLDLGLDWSPLETLRLSLTGFYEFFRDELVSQGGGGPVTYTFNVPASEHRGVEVGAEWRPLPGWRATLAYTFDDQIYTRFVETLSARGLSRAFDRAGLQIPGVPLQVGLARLGYDVQTGPLAGLGAFAEVVVQDRFALDNANLLRAPGYALVNLNLHYDAALAAGPARRISLYLEVRNLFDRVYAASAQNIADALGPGGAQTGTAVLAGTPGAIVAGAPRTLFGGIRLGF